MGNVFPPFKVDLAGTFCIPRELQEAHERYRNGQISLQEMRAIEDSEVSNLVARLKAAGLDVVTDGGLRDMEVVDNWPDYRAELLESFAFLTGATGGDVLAKQHLPSPAEVLARALERRREWGLEVDDEVQEALAEEIAVNFLSLLDDLHNSGCRYVQFDGAHSTCDHISVMLNNYVLRSRPSDLYVAFHAPTEMLIRLEGVDAYFLNYNWRHCDRSKLLWLIRQSKASLGFVLSHYPEPVEWEDVIPGLIAEVLQYIPLERFTLVMPDASLFQMATQRDEARQWETLHRGMELARQLFH